MTPFFYTPAVTRAGEERTVARMGTIHIRLTEGQHQHVRDRARGEDTTIQQFVLAAITEKLAKVPPGRRAHLKLAIRPPRYVGRRWYAFVGLPDAPGIWFADAGVIRMPERWTLDFIVGRCAFCGLGTRRVHAMAACVGRPPRICRDCIDLTLEILVEHGHTSGGPSHGPEPDLAPSIEAFESFSSFAGGPEQHLELATTVRRQLDGPPLPEDEVSGKFCSFCGRSPRQSKVIIAGPGVHICDVCAFDAAELLWRPLGD
jgi:hypothetical protein